MALFPEARRAREAEASEVGMWTPEYDLQADRAARRAEALAEPKTEVEEVRDLDADGVLVRLYRPAGARPGVVVHLHGGGFVLNDIEVHDEICRVSAQRSGVAWLSVEYRRPPEHRFPAAPDDVSTVVRWLEGAAGGLGLDGPVFVHGDSAGANLALVAALRHPDVFRAVVLIYPFLDPTAAGESHRTLASPSESKEGAWFWQQYAASPADLEHPDLAPLLSDRLATLPPTLVVTAEEDPLRDEGELLATRLSEEGVTVVSTRYQGQVHGFWRHLAEFPAAGALVDQVAGFLRSHDG